MAPFTNYETVHMICKRFRKHLEVVVETNGVFLWINLFYIISRHSCVILVNIAVKVKWQYYFSFYKIQTNFYSLQLICRKILSHVAFMLLLWNSTFLLNRLAVQIKDAALDWDPMTMKSMLTRKNYLCVPWIVLQLILNDTLRFPPRSEQVQSFIGLSVIIYANNFFPISFIMTLASTVDIKRDGYAS